MLKRYIHAQQNKNVFNVLVKSSLSKNINYPDRNDTVSVRRISIRVIKKTGNRPWPGGSVGWSIVPLAKRLWVQSLVRARTWAASSTPGRGVHRRQLMDVSL